MLSTFKEICKKHGTDKGDHIINKKGDTYQILISGCF